MRKADEAGEEKPPQKIRKNMIIDRMKALCEILLQAIQSGGFFDAFSQAGKGCILQMNSRKCMKRHTMNESRTLNIQKRERHWKMRKLDSMKHMITNAWPRSWANNQNT